MPWLRGINQPSDYLPAAFKAKAETDTQIILDRLKEEEAKAKAANAPLAAAEKREDPVKT